MTSTPHDALVRAIFGQPQHAAAEIAAVIPPEALAELDLATLQPVPGTFIDPELADREADLLFEVGLRRGGSALLYVLLEHQSTFDPWMALRLLEYQIRIWTQWRRDHPENGREPDPEHGSDSPKLPAIVPIVLHHGERRWAGSTDFAALLDLAPETRRKFGPQLVDFRFLLDDLAASEDEEISRRRMAAVARVALLALKTARLASDFVARFARAAALLREALVEPGAELNLELILRYVFEVRDKDEADELRQTFAKIGSPDLERSTMTTIADHLRAEGRLEGKLEGKLDGRRELLRAQIERRFGPLPQALQDRLVAADGPTLDRWGLQLLDARRIDEIVAG